jgi:2-haloacid dehalogenase
MINLADFALLTFDCYGTMIDWESGIFAGLRPLLSAHQKPSLRTENKEPATGPRFLTSASQY